LITQSIFLHGLNNGQDENEKGYEIWTKWQEGGWVSLEHSEKKFSRTYDIK